MEYFNGMGLREYLECNVNFELGQLVNIMGQLLQALEFAHGKGVAHRDIKPANLIMTANGELKVADFGIARIDASELTLDGAVLGTPAYMSPEQRMGKPSDHCSDLFSAAVVSYDLLTGVKPFVGAVDTLMYKICQVDAMPPSQVASYHLPGTIDSLFAKALTKAPDDRFQQARDFRMALAEALNASELALGSLDLTILNLPPVSMPTKAWDDVVLTTAEPQSIPARNGAG